jgi:hypothetical protein
MLRRGSGSAAWAAVAAARSDAAMKKRMVFEGSTGGDRRIIA